MFSPLIAGISVNAPGWAASLVALGLSVLGFWFLPLIAAGISAIGGAAGQALAGAGRKMQEELLQQAMDEFGNIDPARLKELVAERLGPSALEGVKTDPRLTQEQYAGLDGLTETINNGGLDLAAQADLNRTTSRASRVGSAAINRIDESMNARGAGGSAAAAVLKAQAAQDASQQAHDSGMDAMGMAWQRRMQALNQRTQQAGNMRTQEYGEKARAAEAADAIERQNAQFRDSAARYNNQMAQQRFQNDVAIASGKAGAARGAADNAGANADRTANIATGIGESAGGAVADYADRDWQAEEREKDRRAGVYIPRSY